jgi:hypothetical protein
MAARYVWMKPPGPISDVTRAGGELRALCVAKADRSDERRRRTEKHGSARVAGAGVVRSRGLERFRGDARERGRHGSALRVGRIADRCQTEADVPHRLSDTEPSLPLGKGSAVAVVAVCTRNCSMQKSLAGVVPAGL